MSEHLIWKDICELNEISGEEIWNCEQYEINQYGEVRSIKRNKYQPYNYMKILKPVINKDGYLDFVLPNSKGTRSHLLVHRAVAMLFLTLPEGDLSTWQVDHLNMDKTNSYYKNLEWVTKSENIKRTFENGRVPWNKPK